MFRTLALLAPYFVGGKAVKIKPGSILIFGVGAAVAIGLATWQHSNWYLFALAPFAVWAWLYSVEEINKLSWHYKFTEMTVTWVRPVFSALVVLPAVITLLAMHIIQPPLATFYHGQPVYFTAPATYLAVLAVAGLMELWLAVGWPLVKLAYDKGCPDAKFVEKQRVPAKPQMPPTARPN